MIVCLFVCLPHPPVEGPKAPQILVTDPQIRATGPQIPATGPHTECDYADYVDLAIKRIYALEFSQTIICGCKLTLKVS